MSTCCARVHVCMYVYMCVCMIPMDLRILGMRVRPAIRMRIVVWRAGVGSLCPSARFPVGLRIVYMHTHTSSCLSSPNRTDKSRKRRRVVSCATSCRRLRLSCTRDPYLYSCLSHHLLFVASRSWRLKKDCSRSDRRHSRRDSSRDTDRLNGTSISGPTHDSVMV